MDGFDVWGSPIQAADMVNILEWEEIEEDGKKRRKCLNRSTAYAFADRLPDELKSKIGASLKINLTKMQRWLNEGGDRERAAA